MKMPTLYCDPLTGGKARGLFGIIALFLMLSMVFACQGKTPEELESEAEALYEEANQLWTVGKEFEAFPLYDKIANEYPETLVAENLEKELALKNIAFGSAAASWTIKKLYETENTLVEVFRETGHFPEAYDSGLDAWGQPIKYKVFETGKVDFDFMVVSAGPDGKFETGDDQRLVHARDKREAGASGVGKRPGNAGGGSQESSLENLEKGLENMGVDSEGEKVIGLNDLESLTGKKKGTESGDDSSAEIDLNDLIEGNL